MVRRFSEVQRRARLARRHRLAPEARVDEPTDVLDGIVALHATDAATVHLSALARLRDGTPVAPPRYRLQAPTLGPALAAVLLDNLRARPRLFTPGLPLLDVQGLSADSLLLVLLMGTTRPISGAAREELRRPTQLRAALGGQFGTRPRTDDLLSAYVLNGWGAGVMLPFEALQLRQAIDGVHAPPLRRFLELYAEDLAGPLHALADELPAAG